MLSCMKKIGTQFAGLVAAEDECLGLHRSRYDIGLLEAHCLSLLSHRATSRSPQKRGYSLTIFTYCIIRAHSPETMISMPLSGSEHFVAKGLFVSQTNNVSWTDWLRWRGHIEGYTAGTQGERVEMKSRHLRSMLADRLAAVSTNPSWTDINDISSLFERLLTTRELRAPRVSYECH